MSRTWRRLGADELARIRPVLDFTRAWGGRMIISIADQGLYSGTNFVLNVLLARWLVANEYGAYAVAIGVSNTLGLVGTALVLEPMSIFGPTRSESNFRSYVESVTWMSLLASVGLGIGCGIGAAFATDDALRFSLVALLVGVPMVQLAALARRLQYVRSRPHRAAASSLVYFVSGVAGVIALPRFGTSSGAEGVLIVAMSSLFSSLVVWTDFGLRWPDLRQWRPIREVFWEHWGYGKYLIAMSVLVGATLQVQTSFVGWALGLETLAVLQAMLITVYPITHALLALNVLALPVFARRLARSGGSVPTHILVLVGLAGGSIALGYELVLFLFKDDIVRMLYGPTFASGASLLPVLGLTGVFIGATSGHTVLLRAAARPRLFLAAQVVYAATGIVAGVVLTLTLGLMGAAIGISVAYFALAVATVVMTRFLRVHSHP